MPIAIRFHLDENMPGAVAIGLRKRGRDVTTLIEVNLLAASDESHLAYALAEGRVVITRDQDFLVLDSKGQEHASIVYWTERHHFGQLIKDIDSLCFEKSAEQMHGNVEYL